MSQRKIKKARKTNDGHRQTLQEAMRLIMGMARNVLLNSGYVRRLLGFWVDNRFHWLYPTVDMIVSSPAEMVAVTQLILRDLRVQQAILVDNVHMITHDISEWPDRVSFPIKDHPDSYETIVVLGANKYELLGFIQPFSRKGTQIIFDDLIDDNIVADCPPWFKGVQFADFHRDEMKETSIPPMPVD